MLSIHTEFHPIWSSRRDAVASPNLEIIDGIYCCLTSTIPTERKIVNSMMTQAGTSVVGWDRSLSSLGVPFWFALSRDRIPQIIKWS